MAAGGHVGGYLGGEPISPELVLVDPELARVARESLSDRHDWTIDFEPRARPDSIVLAVEPEPARSGAFVRATQIGAALVLALALFGALGAEELGRSPKRVETAASPAPIRGVLSTTSPAPRKARHHVSAPTPGRTKNRRPAVPTASTPAPESRRPVPPRTSASRKRQPVGSLAKRALGKHGAWGVRRLGRPTSVVHEGRTCRLRWASLKLTLILSLPRPGSSCSRGTVVATIRTP